MLVFNVSISVFYLYTHVHMFVFMLVAFLGFIDSATLRIAFGIFGLCSSISKQRADLILSSQDLNTGLGGHQSQESSPGCLAYNEIS